MGNCTECVTKNDSVVDIISESQSFEYIVFSKANCPECIKTRTFLFTLNKLPKIIELNKSHNKLRTVLASMTKKDKPPYIFYNSEYLGGYNELEAHIKKLKSSHLSV
jgi:glutaredoxin